MKRKSRAEVIEKLSGPAARRELSATEQMRKLLEHPDWAHFFQMCCEVGPDRLLSQVWQWREELVSRGHVFATHDCETALLELAEEKCPESLPAESAKQYLFDRVAKHISDWQKKKGLEFLTSVDEDEILNEAFEVDLAGFRKALRKWAQAGLKRGANGG